jgi:hypothetical protein
MWRDLLKTSLKGMRNRSEQSLWLMHGFALELHLAQEIMLDVMPHQRLSRQIIQEQENLVNQAGTHNERLCQ